MIICLMGATATGKTDLAIALARRLPCEIISVDSAMVYRGLDIGTAKPSPALRGDIPHHLLDICDPATAYSAGQFYQDVVQLIPAIQQRGKIPLLVGGTMLYFRALQYGIAPLPEADSPLRQKINAEAQQHGWPALHQQLTAFDPFTAARLSPHDAQRIQRALEVWYATGLPLSHWQQQTVAPFSQKDFCNIILHVNDREKLRQRIAQRFNTMLAHGFIAEVEQLYARGDLQADLPALRAVGYRQAWQYLSGHSDYATMVQQSIIATQRLAKRQMTWLKSWPNPHIFAYAAADLIDNCYDFLQAEMVGNCSRAD